MSPSSENWFDIMRQATAGDPEAQKLAHEEELNIIAGDAGVPVDDLKLAEEILAPKKKDGPLPRESHWHGAVEASEEERLERWYQERQHPDGQK
ncbi:MAG: hypothetical protein RLZZ347_778 [Candidatus Parcubacteria bacterium]|jgi:hypothetical protein